MLFGLTFDRCQNEPFSWNMASHIYHPFSKTPIRFPTNSHMILPRNISLPHGIRRINGRCFGSDCVRKQNILGIQFSPMEQANDAVLFNGSLHILHCFMMKFHVRQRGGRPPWKICEHGWQSISRPSSEPKWYTCPATDISDKRARRISPV